MNASDVAVLRPAPSSFGHLLRNLRTASNLTQAELAERAGVSERLISDYERGMLHRPRRDTVVLLADGLRLDAGDRVQFVDSARGRSIAPAENTSGDTVRGSKLPSLAGDLVGRTCDVERLTGLLQRDDEQLVTLIGPGGVGKTRLAIEAAKQVAPHFSGGVHFVDLAPVQRADLVIGVIAAAIDVTPNAGQSPIDAVAEALVRGPTLLVLDNFEHVFAAASDVATLLSRCDQITVLVTSRALLHIRAEMPFRVEPLTLPDLLKLPRFEELSHVAAVELFVRRAVVADTRFELTEDNARTVAEITVRLDGLPLAIELAVARLKILSAATLLERLEHRLPVLVGGARDLPERLRTMSAAIAWSYDLLKPGEQRLFRRLSVFSGGFSLEAAEAVCNVGGGTAVDHRSQRSTLDVLISLVDWSLVKVQDAPADSRRFGMLESIREYGLESLAFSREMASARDDHLRWCIDFLERNPFIERASQLSQWITLLDLEHDNIRAALAWAIECNKLEDAQRIAGACHRYWIHRGLCDDASRWFEQIAGLTGNSDPAVRAKALLGQGLVAYAMGRYDQDNVLEQALELYRSTGDENGIALTLKAQGSFAQDQRQFVRAEALDRESLAIFRRIGDTFMATRMLAALGLVAYDRGDYEDAADLMTEALAQAREQEIWLTLGTILNNFALVETERGDYDRATALQQEALEEWRALKYSVGIAHSFENLARIALRRQQLERGVLLFGAAEMSRLAISTPGRLVDLEDNNRLLGEIRAQLGEDAYQVAWEHGRSMTSEEAIDYALELATDH